MKYDQQPFEIWAESWKMHLSEDLIFCKLSFQMHQKPDYFDSKTFTLGAWKQAGSVDRIHMTN